jgi:hypothetical protein
MGLDSAFTELNLGKPSHLEAFVEQWFDVSTGSTIRHPGAKDSYWNPRLGAWEVYKQPAYTLSEQGISSPGIPDVLEPEKIFKLVEDSWAKIGKDHPSAVLDPRSRSWKVAVLTKPGPGKGDDVEERARLCKAELDELDRQYRVLKVLNHDEWVTRRHEVRQEWGFE